MTNLGHMVWSEKSNSYVKSELPEGIVIKLPEEPTEAGQGVARVFIVAKPGEVKEPNETESCQNDANNYIPVDDEDTEIPTERCSDVARDSEEIMKISPLTK